MSYRHNILLILLLVQQCVFGQPITDIKYYAYTNKAELFILHTYYEKALLYYDSAFVEKKVPFAKDRYNAAVCAALLKNNERCYSELKFVLDKGYKISNIQNQELFARFFETNYGKKIIEYDHTSPKPYNSFVRHTIDSLLDADQFFRIKEGSYAVYMDTIRRIDRSNVKVLNELIAKYGFPSEELIGVPDSSFIPISYRILMIHQQNGSPNRVYDYTDVLKKALQEGTIENHLAAELIGKCSGNDLPYGMDVCGVTKCVLGSTSSEAKIFGDPISNRDSVKWGCVILSQEMETKMNKNRKTIGLEDIKDSRAKAVFELKDKRFVFAIPTAYTIYSFDNKKEYEDAVKRMIVLQ
jgi:hypothetical protein